MPWVGEKTTRLGRRDGKLSGRKETKGRKILLQEQRNRYEEEDVLARSFCLRTRFQLRPEIRLRPQAKGEKQGHRNLFEKTEGVGSIDRVSEYSGKLRHGPQFAHVKSERVVYI